MSFKKILITALVLASCGPSKKESVSELNPVDKTDSVSIISPDSIATKGSEGEFNYEDQFKLDTYLVVNIDDNDLQEISESVALLIFPTDAQIEEMKKEYGEEDFYTVADDASFYQGTAIGMIDSLGVNTVTAKNRFVRFKGQGEKSTWTLDIRKAGTAEWNIIFFHKDKDPEIISAIDLTSEKIKDYFEL